MRKSLFFLSLVLLVPFFASARSGCCSWHDGVSHCDTSTGRQVCNDGSYSPSCTCEYIPPKKTDNSWIRKGIEKYAEDTEIEKIRKEINTVKWKYRENHEGFRERLINQIVNYLNADKNRVAGEVYRLLPDVK